MLADLEHLIRLQQLDSAANDARERIAAIPGQIASLESRLETRHRDVADAKATLEEHRTARAAIEKDLAEVQGRLNRYKDQLMAVKTNKEYHAMQSEIANAESEVQTHEDRLLERMVEADDLTREVTDAERRLAEEEEAVRTERAELESSEGDLKRTIAELDADRGQTMAEITPATRDLYETLARGRKGVAVAEARQGLCTACQVHLRPQLFNDIRSNTTLVQCENCQRILYFAEHRHTSADAPREA